MEWEGPLASDAERSQRSRFLPASFDDAAAVRDALGRFCEQARNGKKVVARGTVESVETKEGEYFHLILGNRPSDHMILAR